MTTQDFWLLISSLCFIVAGWMFCEGFCCKKNNDIDLGDLEDAIKKDLHIDELEDALNKGFKK